MEKKTVLFGQEGRKKVLEGIEILHDTIRHMYGSNYRHRIVSNNTDPPKLISNGYFTSSQIELLNPILNIGSSLAKKPLQKINSEFDDGNILTLLLTLSISKHLIKHLENNSSLSLLLNSIEKGKTLLFASLQKQKLQINSANNLLQIATKAADGNEQIASHILEGLKKINLKGSILINVDQNKEIEVELKNGICLDHSRVLLNPSPILNHTKVFIQDDDIKTIQDLLPILEQTRAIEQPLLIIANKITEDALASLKLNSMRKLLNVSIIEKSEIDEKQKHLLESISTAEKVIVKKNKVFIFHKKFSENICLINVNSNHLKKTYETCLNVCQHALNTGVVPGGGLALFNASESIDLRTLTNEEKMGCEIIKTAAKESIKTLIENAGFDPNPILEEILKKGTSFGFNNKTKEVSNLINDGIVDSIDLIKAAFDQAIHTAETLAACEVVINTNKL